jgi:hypothetical protein
VEDKGEAWEQVKQRFESLGSSFRRHYQEQGSGEESGSGEQEVKDALKTLTEAADRLATSTGKALRDPQVRDEVKGAGSALVDALNATFSELGGEFRKRKGT